MAKDYGMDRLGGPPGLYDSPNLDRESGGGIVQRMRVPDAPQAEERFMGGMGLPGPVGFTRVALAENLQDSDNAQDLAGARDPNNDPITGGSAKDGIAFRKSIAGHQS